MKNYSLFFDDARFDIDVVPRTRHTPLYELSSDRNALYILVPFQGDQKDALKILYPLSDYQHLLDHTKKKLLWEFLLLSLVAAFISTLFSFYVLRPLRQSLELLEIFIKDIIHDLNTPLTSILINLKMMDSQSEEVKSIARSAKTIAMLHYNLNAYLKELTFTHERFDIKEVIEEQIALFAPLYNYLTWEDHLHSFIIKSDKHAFSRIIYNLLSNACKYNTPNGTITIDLKDHLLSISNTSYGIKEPSRIFERFYKESDRGLGIGLHIVDKLCKELHIDYSLHIEGTQVTVLLDLSKVTLN